MGLILPQEVEVCVAVNSKYYINKGYQIPTHKMSDGTDKYDMDASITVDVLDLPRGSNVHVRCVCDYCGAEFSRQYCAIYKVLHSKNPKIACGKKSCCKSKKSETLTGRMKQDFESWCITNDRSDLLQRWDYTLNQCGPSDVSSASHREYWFRCGRGLHPSESFAPSTLTHTNNKTRLAGECRKCGSLAQHLIDHYGDDALQKYWDYAKNTVDPWELRAASRNKVWIKCNSTDYHGSFDIEAFNIKKDYKCPYCRKRRIHPKDSFAQSLIDMYGDDVLERVWDYDRNTVSPWEIPPSGITRVWLKCLENDTHPSYCVVTNDFNSKFQRCPLCSSSLGERKISAYLQKRNIEYIREYRDERCKDIFALPFDFYIASLKTMIEYQGIQHYQPVDFSGHGSYDVEQTFIRQQRHDALKREFCDKYGYHLIAIPYTEIDHLIGYLNNQFSEITKEVWK